MIRERRVEFNIQLGVFFASILIFIGSCIVGNIGIGFICFYFGVGISQLISLIVKFFSTDKLSTFMKVYAWMILPIWSILLISWILTDSAFNAIFISRTVRYFLGSTALFYLIAALFFSPALAIGFLINLHATMWRNDTRL